MKHFSISLILALGLATGTVHAQRQIKQVQSSNADVSTLEGVTLKHGQSAMLIVANATIQKTANSSDKIAAANAVIAPTFLQKVGPYEIHRSNASVSASAASSAKPNFTVNGKSVPSFAQEGSGQDFLGAAYLMDTKQLGLISKEIAVKFKSSTVPKQYADLGAKELVPRSGLYVFTVTDIYTWIKLVARLQADAQVSVVEPQIKTEFAQAQ
ncbi:MAG: hypothetical protein RJB34_729 [Pseudomonadota bacterium]|jgi:hypothetical protein